MAKTLPSSLRPVLMRPVSHWLRSPSFAGWRGWARCQAPAVHGSEEALSPSLAQTGTPAGGCGPSADSLDPDASLLGWHCCSVNGTGQQQCSISGEFKSILYFTEVCICFFFFERIYCPTLRVELTQDWLLLGSSISTALKSVCESTFSFKYIV